MKAYGEGVGNMKEKKDLLERLGVHLDLPREALPRGFSVLLSGQGELCVQGRARILSYKEDEIVLLIEKKRMRVVGKQLFCASFERENVRIIGTVMGVIFETEEKHAD